jgi:hypothetical protein
MNNPSVWDEYLDHVLYACRTKAHSVFEIPPYDKTPNSTRQNLP